MSVNNYFAFIQATIAVASLVSLVCAATVMFFKDGPLWSVFQALCVFSAVSAIGSFWLTWGHNPPVEIVQHPGFNLIALGRNGMSICQAAMAVMLWRNIAAFRGGGNDREPQ